jgi:hypothetical protein
MITEKGRAKNGEITEKEGIKGIEVSTRSRWPIQLKWV